MSGNPSASGARQLRAVVASPELSLAAKGLLALLQQHPHGMTRQAIFEATSDPMTRIRDAAKELAAAGLVEMVVPSKGRQRRALDRVRIVDPPAVQPEPEPILSRSAAYGRPERHGDLPAWLWPSPAWHPATSGGDGAPAPAATPKRRPARG